MIETNEDILRGLSLAVKRANLQKICAMDDWEDLCYWLTQLKERANADRKERAKSDDDGAETEYLIIGSNNFWYSTESTLGNAVITAKEIRREHSGFSDPETGHKPEKPETLYIYEAREKKRI